MIKQKQLPSIHGYEKAISVFFFLGELTTAGVPTSPILRTQEVA